MIYPLQSPCNHHVITMDIFSWLKTQPTRSFSFLSLELWKIPRAIAELAHRWPQRSTARCQGASCHGMSVKQICKWYTQYDENDETHKFKSKLNLIYIIPYLNGVMCMLIPPCLRCSKFPTSSLTVASTDGTSCPTGEIWTNWHWNA